MQRYAAMILALLLALTTAGCMAPAAQETQEHAGNGVALETLEATAGSDRGITLSAKDVTPTGLTLVIAQSGGTPSGTLQFGSSFQLSVLVDGVWSDVGSGLEYTIPELRDFDCAVFRMTPLTRESTC